MEPDPESILNLVQDKVQDDKSFVLSPIAKRSFVLERGLESTFEYKDFSIQIAKSDSLEVTAFNLQLSTFT